MDAHFSIQCRWDSEAGVWYVEDSDVPGLVTEAPTQKDMVAKPRGMILELLELNDALPPPGPAHVDVLWERSSEGSFKVAVGG